ncbi:hypothetical protein [Phytobacter sp. V91]|uniref:hypothetical protein n=1 Tax=Phytobacter sp. V91 TaxID=3369425 RepID=UPI003F5DCDE6
MKNPSLRLSALLFALVASGCSQNQINHQINQLQQLIGTQNPTASESQQKASIPGIRNDVVKTYTLPVNVDVAAMRLKQHYNFTSDADVAAARNNGQGNAGWSASAISEGASWSAQPGSYYRMSRNWAGNDRLTIEISNSGKGSTIMATYRSSNPEHLKPEWTSRLWKQIPEVVGGLE